MHKINWTVPLKNLSHLKDN